uniref:nuclear transport factor 2 family protein n=1 Tax=Stappia sp. TaxID=1870903 RepID=UPI003BAB919B
MQERAEQAVKAYFDACNSGDRDAFYRLFEPDACHFLPKGMFGPFRDIESLFDQWRRDVIDNGSYWLLDAVFVNPNGQMACAEWTAVKPAQDIHFRGVDIFAFSPEGRIREVRVYYAAPRDPTIGPNELGGFDYAAAGWSVSPDRRGQLSEDGV